jgi:tetratricopeptide (TPR) repeat protein
LDRSAEAELEYREVLRTFPERASLRRGLGIALAGQKRFEEAEKEYRLAIQFDPRYALAHYNYGNLLHQLGRAEEAEAKWAEAVRLRPSLAEARVNLGLMLLDRDRLDEAEAQFRAAIKAKPSLVPAHTNLALVQRQRNDLAGAEASYRKAIRLDGRSALAHRELGLMLAQQKRYAAALPLLNRAVELDPKDAPGHEHLGTTLFMHNQVARGEAALRKAVQLDPSRDGAWFNLGDICFQQRRWAEAEKAFRAALDANPQKWEAHLNLSNVYRLRAQTNRAVEELRKALQIQPNAHLARLNLAGLLTSQGKFAETEAEDSEIVRRMPQWATGYQNQGITFALQGKWDRALAAFTRAAELGADDGSESGDEFARQRSAADRLRINEELWRTTALLRLQCGDRKGHRAACLELVKRFGTPRDRDSVIGIATVCCLAPEPDARAERILDGLTADGKGDARDFLIAKALVEHRGGRPTRAVAWLMKNPPKAKCCSYDAAAFAILALAHQQLGERGQAREALASARSTIEVKMPDTARGQTFDRTWRDWLRAMILLREAEAALK